MPSRNVIREFAADEYYHVYNRGVEKRVIFLDEQDYTVFIGLLKKYLSGINDNKTHWHKSDNLAGEVELLAYCLMPNHFHILFYQRSANAITKLMRRLVTGYVMYFNKRYSRTGPLFSGRYKASHINADAYLHHISRYIHMNPKEYASWPYSSLPYYAGQRKTPTWLNTELVLGLFNNSSTEYLDFIRNYHDSKAELSVLKWQLANDPEDKD